MYLKWELKQSRELKDDTHNLKLKQIANMPNEDKITLQVSAADGGQVAEGTDLKLRKPDWIAGDPKQQ